MFFDVAVLLSNFNKLTNKIIPSARLSPYFSYKTKAILNIYHFVFCLKKYFHKPQTSKNIAIIYFVDFVHCTQSVCKHCIYIYFFLVICRRSLQKLQNLSWKKFFLNRTTNFFLFFILLCVCLLYFLNF